MTRRELLIATLLIAVGCAQMAGDVLGIPILKALGAATGASPAPRVFTAQDGFETYANRFFLDWEDAAGVRQVLEITPQVYSGVRGPYNRRNAYGAVFSYAPVLYSNPRTRSMFRTVLERSFCGTPSILEEIGIPVDVARKKPLRVRLEPRRAGETQRFALIHEVNCGG
jgi:hypothetical protein